MSELDQRLEEFWQNVWDHGADAFQRQFDERRLLTPSELAELETVQSILYQSADDEAAAQQLLIHLKKNKPLFELLLQLSGLTRNKLVSDFRASKAARGTKKMPRSHNALIGNEAYWRIAGPWLVSRLRKTVGLVDVKSSAEALNQATWPSFIRQERAKRSGHEAEGRLATLFQQCGIPFEPQQKADNPLVPDIKIYDVSFDLVVPSAQNPKVVFKATVHTANIGQFGESKDALEISEAKAMIADRDIDAILFALIDGGGFTSNKDGLIQVLRNTDEFCQFETLWKAPYCCAAVTNTDLTIEIPDDDFEEHSAFIKRYESPTAKLVPKSIMHEALLRIPAGRGAVLKV
jgi:hypothetical protein